MNFANDAVVDGKLSLIITKKLSFPELAPWPGSSMQKSTFATDSRTKYSFSQKRSFC